MTMKPDRPQKMKIFLGAIIAGLVAFPILSPFPSSRAEPVLQAAGLQSLRNVGKAYYEQGKYQEAIAEFAKVTASGGSTADDHFNLGVALMQDRQLEAALGELTTARRMAPQMNAALYNLGILYKRQLRYPKAEKILEQVVRVDPTDPASWFNLAKVRFDQRKLEEALEAYGRVDAMGFGKGQNFYVATLFHSFTSLMRLRQREKAQGYFKRHQAIKDRVPGISLQLPALEGGKYGAIRVPPPAGQAAASQSFSPKLSFREVTKEMGFPEATGKAGLLSDRAFAPPRPDDTPELKFESDSPVTTARGIAYLWDPSWVLTDYDRDSDVDFLFVNPTGFSSLFRNDGNGKFSDVTGQTDLNLLSITGAAFGDYDNSGKLSLLAVGGTGAMLLQPNDAGKYTDVTEKAGLQRLSGELVTSGVFFDADHDGLLDIFFCSFGDFSSLPPKGLVRFPVDVPAGRLHFYRNNGDGTFSERTKTAGLSAPRGRYRSVLVSDFNNDAYMDVVVTREDGSPLVYMGLGEGKFLSHTAKAGAAFQTVKARRAESADFNHDGMMDLVLWTKGRPVLLANRGGGQFSSLKGFPKASAPSAGRVKGQVADLNADGYDDLLWADEKGIQILLNRFGTGFEAAQVNLSDMAFGSKLAASTVGPLRGWGGTDLLTFDHDGMIRVFEKQGAPSGWLRIELEGSKSSKQGVGSTVEIKAGNYYRKVLVTGEPLQLFTGNRTKIDVVRVRWPNLIIQNRMEVNPNQGLKLRESERLASSCPFLYVWDGAQYVFLTDVLGIAPLGELMPDGAYALPNSEEYVRIPGERMKQQAGRYVLQFTNELREADYFDSARLFAYDHPADQDIYADERYAAPPFPSPSVHTVCGKRFPVSAVDHHGHNVLPQLRHHDGTYAGDFRRHGVMGVAETHTLTLDLGKTGSHISKLFLTGWVLWTDSNGARALSTNFDFTVVPPRLEVKDESGRWVTVMEDFGLPSGTDRTLVADLTGKFLSPDRQVRIVTNLCVYWDQIFYSADPVGGNSCAEPRPIELPLLSADLHYRGFSTPIHDPLYRRPDSFDYHRRLAVAPWNPHAGLYTRYGEVQELLSEADDRLAVLSVGDELTAEFDARNLPPLPRGWKRDFILHAQGWAKAGDPNTGTGRAVGPLPFRAMRDYPYEETKARPHAAEYETYFSTYQTRRAQTLIPPLAPFRSSPPASPPAAAAGGN